MYINMKHTAMALLMCLTSLAAMAQGRTLNLEARGGESFSVFVDGDLQNRMPQTRVMVTGLTDQPHEVVVVLRRPAQKAATVMLHLDAATTNIAVSYDQPTDRLTLEAPGQVRPAPRSLPVRQPVAVPADHRRVAEREVLRTDAPAEPQLVARQSALHRRGQEVRRTSDSDLRGMVDRMKAQPYDSDRLALGKVMVASADLTSEQITSLAATFDYATSKVDFLQYAYHYCIDPVNYHRTTDVLNFSSDKKRVLDYIASQK